MNPALVDRNEEWLVQHLTVVGIKSGSGNIVDILKDEQLLQQHQPEMLLKSDRCLTSAKSTSCSNE